MPKIIDDVENVILKTAANIIQKDYRKFSIRNVAEKCNIGIGTVYNYFPSKEDLLNKAMKFFINERFLTIEGKVGRVHTAKEKCFEIYKDLQGHFEEVRKNKSDQLCLMITSSESKSKILRGNIDIAIKRLFSIIKKEFNIEEEFVAKVIAIILFIPNEEKIPFEDIWNTINKLLVIKKEVEE